MNRDNSKEKSRKCLIVYFSRSGKNYVGGQIVDLTVGNTEVVAKTIQEKTGGDLFRIEPVQKYPNEYTATTEVAKEELRTKARPELARSVKDIRSYDLILLGYPCWWGTMPMPVFSFLEGHDLSGKIIAPFCTHEGSGLGQSISDLQETCPKSTILEGIAIRGNDVKNAQGLVTSWLHDIDRAMNT